MTSHGDWKTEPLGRVARLTMGQSPDSKYYSEEETGWPFLQGCAEFQSRFPAPKLFCTHKQKVGKQGSILFSVRAPVGRINIADRDYVIGRGLAAIEGSEVDQDYLEQYLNYIAPSFRNASQGSTFEAINSNELNAWPIPHPSEQPEQAKIAEILSTVDRAIEEAEALIAKRQRIKTGLMQDLLTRGIDEAGNLRSERTHEFKDSPVGRIPVQWAFHPISKFGSKTRPWLRTGPFGSDLNTKHWVTEGVPVLTIGSLGEGEVIEGELLFVNEASSETLKAFRVSPGDIVFSRVADIGRSLVIRPHQDAWIISSNLMRISVDPTRANPEFLYRNIAFNSAVRAQLRTHANSGGRELVNGPILSGLVFPWPDIGEQERIVSHLATEDKNMQMLVESLEKLFRVKTGLMQDLLTGKKRVTALLEPEPKREKVYASQ